MSTSEGRCAVSRKVQCRRFRRRPERRGGGRQTAWPMTDLLVPRHKLQSPTYLETSRNQSMLPLIPGQPINLALASRRQPLKRLMVAVRTQHARRAARRTDREQLSAHRLQVHYTRSPATALRSLVGRRHESRSCARQYCSPHPKGTHICELLRTHKKELNNARAEG